MTGPRGKVRHHRPRSGLRAGELTILVADKGCGIGRALASPGLGLGLAVIDESCEALAIRSRPGRGIELELRFRLRPWSDSPRPAGDVAEVSAGSVTEPIFGAGPSSDCAVAGPVAGPAPASLLRPLVADFARPRPSARRDRARPLCARDAGLRLAAMSPLAVRRYRADRLLQAEFRQLQGRVIGVVAQACGGDRRRP